MVVPPYIVDDRSTQSLSVVEGGSTAFKCKANGVPTPKVSWILPFANKRNQQRKREIIYTNDF